MNVPLLIGAIVRQTTVLIAQLATVGGVRAPLAQVANQVFLDLVEELKRQGISRKVSADMFGMGLRSYLRRVQRLEESSTERGRSLWEAVLGYLQEQGVTTRAAVFQRFHRDDEVLVRGVLHDLSESGLVFVSGSGSNAAYRAATEQELGTLRRLKGQEGLDELVWALVYREGPMTEDDLLKQGGFSGDALAQVLLRLVNAGRIERVVVDGLPAFRAESFFVPLDGGVGFEAAVFDHFQAAVKTITRRLRGDPSPLPLPDGLTERDVTGGSTYTFDVWPGHPLSVEVLRQLTLARERLGELRQQVEAYNAEAGVPDSFVKVMAYAGQCLIPEGQSEQEEQDS